MSNFFKQAQDNANGLSKQLLGPGYDYKGKIKTTRELGMSGTGTLPALEADVRGLIGYVKVLTVGGGSASRVNGPLGNKFFLKTGGLCKDVKTKKEVPRYLYINNVPNPPFNGLIKGTTTGVNSINPFKLMGAFSSTKMPDCRKVTMDVIDHNNRKTRETNYVTLNDIKYMREGFENNETCDGSVEKDTADVFFPDDIPIQFYYACLSVFSIYIVYRLIQK